MIYVANMLHMSGKDISRPLWDTLIGLFNQEPFDVTARITLHGDNGQVVQWPSGLAYAEVVLKSGLGWAATFIPGNGFENPPQDWMGFGLITFSHATPFGVQQLDNPRVTGWCLASGGNFDQKSASIEIAVRKVLNAQSAWTLPYSIPHYEDQDHPGTSAYVTGFSIANFDNQPVNVTVTYTVFQTYGEMGQNWSFTSAIPATGALRTDLATQLFKAGMPTNLNSEGALTITSDVPARLFPFAIIATADYLFSAGEGFVD